MLYWLADLGPTSAGAVLDIRRATSDADLAVREAADRARRAAGAEAVPTAMSDLKMPTRRSGSKAPQVIARYYRYPGTLEAVIAASRDRDRTVRIRAVGIFAGIADNPNSGVYFSLQPSIWADAADQVVPALVAASQDADRDVRYVAYMGLRTLGPAAKAAVPQLLKSWKTADMIDQCRIATALGKIGPVSDEILPLLYGALAPSNAPGSATTTGALGHVGPPAKEAVPKLIGLFRDPGTADRRRAASIQGTCIGALRRIAPEDDRVIRLLAARVVGRKA